MDRLSPMETFVAVVEAGSFSGAARRLELGQPAVSKIIAQLEQRLGTRLLLRSPRGLTRVRPRGERSSNRVPSRCSSCAMILDTAGCPSSSRRAAPENEPASTTATNVSMGDSRSMTHSSRYERPPS